MLKISAASRARGATPSILLFERFERRVGHDLHRQSHQRDYSFATRPGFTGRSRSSVDRAGLDGSALVCRPLRGLHRRGGRFACRFIGEPRSLRPRTQPEVKAVFADAFYFVALINRSDQHHARAIAAARHLHENLITTEWVLMEFADAFAESGSRRLVAPFIRELHEDPNVEIVSATADLFQRGLRLYDERKDKGWMLTDCTSFVVMRDGGITGALTGDHHFQQAGFQALLM